MSDVLENCFYFISSLMENRRGELFGQLRILL